MTIFGNALMAAHLGGLREALSTLFARKRLLSCVRPHVVVQRCRPGKRARAESTLERSLVVVGYDMSPQLCGVSEGHVAVAAVVGIVGLARTYV